MAHKLTINRRLDGVIARITLVQGAGFSIGIDALRRGLTVLPGAILSGFMIIHILFKSFIIFLGIQIVSNGNDHSSQYSQGDESSRRYKKKRETILSAAVQAVIARGYDAVRLRDVSSRGGFSIGLIQHHFDTREELFREALHRASLTLVRNFTESPSTPSSPWKRIEWLISQWSSVTNMKQHAQAWLAFADAASKHSDIEGHFSEIYRHWYEYTYEAVSAGIRDKSLNPPLPLEDTVSIFMAFFDGYEFQVANDRVEQNAETLHRRATQLAYHLFRPTGSTGSATPAYSEPEILHRRPESKSG